MLLAIAENVQKVVILNGVKESRKAFVLIQNRLLRCSSSQWRRVYTFWTSSFYISFIPVIFKIEMIICTVIRFTVTSNSYNWNGKMIVYTAGYCYRTVIKCSRRV